MSELSDIKAEVRALGKMRDELLRVLGSAQETLQTTHRSLGVSSSTLGNALDNDAEKKARHLRPQIERAIPALAKVEERLDGIDAAFRDAAKAFNSMRYILEGVNSAVRSRLAGVGIEPKTDTLGDGVLEIAEPLTDEGFLAARKEVGGCGNAYSRMGKCVDVIKAAPFALADIRHRRTKLADRIKRSRADKGSAEYKTAQSLARKLGVMEQIVTDRAAVFIEDFGKCASRTLNRTLGLTEKMTLAIVEAKLTKVGADKLGNIERITARLNAELYKAKGGR